MKNLRKIKKYRTALVSLAFFINWGLICLIGPGKPHSEPVSMLLCFLGLMWAGLLLGIAISATSSTADSDATV